MIQSILFIDEINQAVTLLNSMRVQLFKLMGTPITCTQLGKALGEGPQKVYCHVKKLHIAGPVDKVKEQRVRGSVQVDIDIDASTTRVFEVLTNPEELRRYISTDPTGGLEIGVHFNYGWGNDGPVKLLDLQPDKTLAYQWNNPETVVTWTLEGSDNKTHLTIVHSGFSVDKEIDGYHVGWSKYLHRIKFIFEARSEFVRIVGDTTN